MNAQWLHCSKRHVVGGSIESNAKGLNSDQLEGLAFSLLLDAFLFYPSHQYSIDLFEPLLVGEPNPRGVEVGVALFSDDLLKDILTVLEIDSLFQI
jgi:hypothetical protein